MEHGITRKEFSALLRQARLDKGLTQAAAAELASGELVLDNFKVSNAENTDLARYDYIRLALAPVLLGQTWSKERVMVTTFKPDEYVM